MRDSNLYKFFRVFGALRYRSVEKLRERLERMPPHHRLLLVAGLFALFLIVDIYYIAQAFTGDDAPPIEVEHIKQIPVARSLPDSTNLTTPFDYDTDQ